MVSTNGRKPRTKRTRAGGTRNTRNWQSRFLSSLSGSGNVTLACAAAKVGRTRAYQERQRNEAFAVAWHEALEEACDELEQEARRRALKGSDYLLALLLKAHRPERFADRAKLEHTGADGGPIHVSVDPSKLSDATLEELEAAAEAS